MIQTLFRYSFLASVFFNTWLLSRTSEHPWDYLIYASFAFNSVYLVFVVLWHMMQNLESRPETVFGRSYLEKSVIPDYHHKR